MNISCIIIAAAASGAGKTTIATGLMTALAWQTANVNVRIISENNYRKGTLKS